MTFNTNIVIKANDEHSAKIKIAVINNLLENLTDNQFVNVLYPRIKNNKDFFKKLADNPLLKML